MLAFSIAALIIMTAAGSVLLLMREYYRHNKFGKIGWGILIATIIPDGIAQSSSRGNIGFLIIIAAVLIYIASIPAFAMFMAAKEKTGVLDILKKINENIKSNREKS